MRPVRASAVTATLMGTALLALSAPAAFAVTDPTPVGTVLPSTVRTGQTVRLTLRNCPSGVAVGFASGGIVNRSPLTMAPIGITPLRPGTNGLLNGTATISNVVRGTRYNVYFTCDANLGSMVSTSVTVR